MAEILAALIETVREQRAVTFLGAGAEGALFRQRENL
jgi:hypothetical protein